MGRSIATIQAGIWASVLADTTLVAELTSTSTTAIWCLWTWVIATQMFVMEGLTDFAQLEVTNIIATQKPHSLQWYATKGLAFQYGAALPADTDVYNPVAPAGDPSLIVTFAVAVEISNRVRIKAATGTVGALSALSTPQLTAFSTYMGQIKDAGVKVLCTSGPGDTFQPTQTIYYDPLILDNTGARLDGTEATPIQDAINTFLNGLGFNGKLRLNDYIAAMQAVAGVVIADEVSIQAFYGTVPPVVITTEYTPDAGYLVLDTVWFAAHINYVAYTG